MIATLDGAPLLRSIIVQLLGDADKGSPHAQVTIWESGCNVARFVAFKFASRQMGITDNPLILIDNNSGEADGSSYLLSEGRSDAGDVSVGRARIVNSASGYQQDL